jgi:hypothetical protein
MKEDGTESDIAFQEYYCFQAKSGLPGNLPEPAGCRKKFQIRVLKEFPGRETGNL